MELANQIFDAKLEVCDKNPPVNGKKMIYMSAKMSQTEKGLLYVKPTQKD